MGFSGLFLRHFMNDSPGTPYTGQTLSDSPDIILEGSSVTIPPTVLVTPQNYATEPPDTLFTGNATNYIYVRALNASTGPIASRLWLWYARPAVLVWPQSWTFNDIYVAGALQNWSNVNATSPSQIVVSDAFAVVNPDQPADHYCMVAIAENPDGGFPISQPPQAPFPGAFTDLNAFAAWVATTPNAAWRNTYDVPASEPGTWNFEAPLPGPANSGTMNIGVQCQNVPVGSQYRFTVPGGTTPSGQSWSAIDSGMRTVVNPNEAVTVQVTWPGGVLTGMSISWFANGKAVQAGQQIVPYVGFPSPRLEGLLDDPLQGATWALIYEDPADLEPQRVEYQVVVGSIPFKIVGG